MEIEDRFPANEQEQKEIERTEKISTAINTVNIFYGSEMSLPEQELRKYLLHNSDLVVLHSSNDSQLKNKPFKVIFELMNC